METVKIKLLFGIVVNKKIGKRGDVFEVSVAEAKELVWKGKAELVKEAPAPPEPDKKEPKK